MSLRPAPGPMMISGARSAIIALALSLTLIQWVWTARPAEQGLIFGRFSKYAFLPNLCTTYAAVGVTWVLWRRQSSPARFIGLCAVTMSLVIACGMLETVAFLGVVDYRIFLNTAEVKPWENPRNLQDRELIYVHRPHDRFQGDMAGDLTRWLGIPTDRRYPVDVQYDRNGFRNLTDIETADIVFIGDSFVEGPIVAYEELASTRLAKLLGRTVLNLGQVGYGPQQELHVLRRYGLPARPRLVVWSLFEGNDLTHDFLRYEQFAADWDAYLSAHHSFASRSFLRNGLAWLARATSNGLAASTLAKRRRVTLRAPVPAAEKEVYLCFESKPLTASDIRTLNQALAVVGSGITLCREQGVAVLVVFSPIRFRVFEPYCEIPSDSEAANWATTDAEDRVRAWAERERVAYCDLTPGLREATAAGRLPYYVDDGHWNAVGHAVAAEMIARRIAEMNPSPWATATVARPSVAPRGGRIP